MKKYIFILIAFFIPLFSFASYLNGFGSLQEGGTSWIWSSDPGFTNVYVKIGTTLEGGDLSTSCLSTSQIYNGNGSGFGLSSYPIGIVYYNFYSGSGCTGFEGYLLLYSNGDGTYSDASGSVSHFVSLNSPFNNGLVISTSTVFDFDYYNGSEGYDRVYAEYKNVLTGQTFRSPYKIINASGGANYSSSSPVAMDTYYRWYAVMEDTGSTSTPRLFSQTFTFSTFFSTSTQTFIPNSVITSDDFSGYTYITPSSTPVAFLFCERFPFSYACDVYDIILTASHTSTSSVSSILYTFDVSSSTSQLLASTSLNVSSIPPAVMLSQNTLQYFIPNSVASIFRGLVNVGVFFGFAYMVWTSIMNLIKIQT